MARPEPPVDATVPARAALATHLRQLRDQALLTNPQLAQKIGVDASTVRRAASGRFIPKRSLVLAWTQCTGGDKAALLLWREARHQTRSVAADLRKSLPAPELIVTRAELSLGLIDLYERAGALPIHEMERLGGAYRQLPHSTLNRILNRKTLPGSREQCEALLIACGISALARNAWLEAWKRVTTKEMKPGENPARSNTADYTPYAAQSGNRTIPQFRRQNDVRPPYVAVLQARDSQGVRAEHQAWADHQKALRQARDQEEAARQSQTHHNTATAW